MSSAGPNPSVGADLIAAERQRQISAEGWTPEHDDAHTWPSLAVAAACYATPASLRDCHVRDGIPQEPRTWPWAGRFWKPTPDDRVRELVKAGALIAAEIDRLVRAKGSQGTAPDPT
jgi:hypothetical protein